MSQTAPSGSNGSSEERLESWKEIAVYLRRDVTTVQRWEKKEGLPIHRHLHDRQGSVHAYKTEVDNWRQERLAIIEKDQPAAPVAPATTWYPSRRTAVALAAAAVLLTGLAATFGARDRVSNRAHATPQPTRRFTITVPPPYELPTGRGNVIALSPDGRTLVYRGVQYGGVTALFRRPLDRFEATVIPGTEGGGDPLVFSPDGQWLAFRVGDTLKKMTMTGGPAQTMAAIDGSSRGGSWTTDGPIVIGQDTGLFRVPFGGGEATRLSKGDGSNRSWYPQVIGGGRFVLFTQSWKAPDSGSVHLLDLTSGQSRSVLLNAVSGRVLPSGHLIFVRSGALWAVPFDPDRLEPIGPALPVIEGVRVEGGGAVQYSVSDEGTLAYVAGTVAVARTLAFVGRDGRAESLSGPPRDYRYTAWSRDESRIAVQISDGADADVWVVETARGSLTRVTTDPGFDGGPLWSADGSSIVFASERGGHWLMQRRAADGTGATEVLARFDKATSVQPTSLSPDGATLVLTVDDDVVVVSAKEQPRLLLNAARQAVISPDGRLIAYSSNESGHPEVYLQRFPALGDRRMVSGAGSSVKPSWSRDGRELFYLSGSDRIPRSVMRASVRINAAGTVDIGTPAVLTTLQPQSRVGAYMSYDVSTDGQRMLMMTYDDPGGPLRSINVVVNWFEELRRLVPIK